MAARICNSCAQNRKGMCKHKNVDISQWYPRGGTWQRPGALAVTRCPGYKRSERDTDLIAELAESNVSSPGEAR